MGESKDPYRDLVENLPAFSYIAAYEKEHPTQQIPLYMSPQALELSGYSAEEWSEDHQLWQKLIHPDDQGRVIAESWRTSLEGVPYLTEYRLLHKDGSIVWVREQATLVREEGRDVWYGFIIDIGDRKGGEEPA